MQWGRRGYADIGHASTVTVTNAAGTIIGMGTLDTGVVHDSGKPFPFDCVFKFAVSNLPASLLHVQVSHRGQITIPSDGLSSVALTLG